LAVNHLFVSLQHLACVSTPAVGREKENVMSIVPISLLSRSELSRLGNNLRSTMRPRPTAQVLAVNRSLAVHDEQVRSLYRRKLNAAAWLGVAMAAGKGVG
jgi:hypothetical protein